MRKLLYFLVSILLLQTISGCGGKHSEYGLNKNRAVAVLTVDGNVKALDKNDQTEFARVIRWMDRDLINRLRKKDFQTAYLKEMKDYSSEMGDLFIVNVEYFAPGRKKSAPGPSSLELKYRLLDEKGALVTEWEDGADSRRGGTYSAKLLNHKAVEKLDNLYPSP